jgi:hypothetical protein
MVLDRISTNTGLLRTGVERIVYEGTAFQSRHLFPGASRAKPGQRLVSHSTVLRRVSS